MKADHGRIQQELLRNLDQGDYLFGKEDWLEHLRGEVPGEVEVSRIQQCVNWEDRNRYPQEFGCS